MASHIKPLQSQGHVKNTDEASPMLIACLVSGEIKNLKENIRLHIFHDIGLAAAELY